MEGRRHLKEYASLKEELARNMALNFFTEEDIQPLLKELDSFPGGFRRKVAALCYQLSNTSSNLVERTLGHIRQASALLSEAALDAWLDRAFELLDSSGLQAAVEFISRGGSGALGMNYVNQGAVRLEAIGGRLELYIKGISGMDFHIRPTDLPCYTDLSTIYLPEKLEAFGASDENLLLYRLMAVHKWAQAAGGTLPPPPALADLISPAASPEFPSEDFPGTALFALDLYNVLEAIRLDAFLKKEVPGLFEKTVPLRMLLLRDRAAQKNPGSSRTAFIEGLFELYLAQGAGDALYKTSLVDRKVFDLWRRARGHENAVESAGAVIDICRGTEYPQKGIYEPPDLLFIGRIRPLEVVRQVLARRLALKKKMEDLVTQLLNAPEMDPGPGRKGKKKAPFRQAKPGATYLLVRGKLIELDEEMKSALSSPEGEGQATPGGVLVDGAAAGGRHVYRLADFAGEATGNGEEAGPGGKAIRYDEWDFKRGGYRKDWCTITEQDVQAGHDPFVEQTLKKYGGYVTSLRNKFELLRREPKLLRRQPDGEDIDVDAMVEAMADMKAGLVPSGNDLFIRHERKERDIAALFLLDMSGSTKGWVNLAEKESLVLMCEAIEALGDRYAIYGFSGMTRGRCDFYRIKGFGETFGMTVKKRIAGITPRDYTRMGPAIRHASSILGKTGAGTRLLIVLSDGRPEDYDAYKGDYGVEDTKKALLEARERGLHPFCITIDKEARQYLPHMYGAANYVLIDDVRKLPGRIPEIYRRLTA